MDNVNELTPTIGLEIHAQLSTRSKMFCYCAADYFNAQPNSLVCAVCGGMPGALPVINSRAVEFGIRTALALHCHVPPNSKFDRKNYPYPDIPKGFQISQYDQPIGIGGWLDYEIEGHVERCGIVRVHLEEDTGKTMHETVRGKVLSLIDYNRSGVALMEIVTEPELHSPSSAAEFFAGLRRVLLYLGVCNGRLEEGSMRADVNVSVARHGDDAGTKVEIKNLNSFRAVERAISFEVERQRQIIFNGGHIEQETRGWLEREEATIGQRSKEYAHDYRYFPEPDLPPLEMKTSWLEKIKAALPELPLERKKRFEREYGLLEPIAAILTDEFDRADFFERAVQLSGADPRSVANWVTGDVSRLWNESHTGPHSSLLAPDALGRIVSLIEEKTISGAAGKRVLDEVFRTGENPDSVVARKNLSQISDLGELERLVESVCDANRGIVDDYRGGKKNALEALVGKAMKESKGRANPAALREIMERRLGALV